MRRPSLLACQRRFVCWRFSFCRHGKGGCMTDLHVEAARIPDRDRLLQTLREAGLDARPVDEVGIEVPLQDRKSTRLNSSHRCISYAVFCLKKKKTRTRNSGP